LLSKLSIIMNLKLADKVLFKQQALRWANQFNVCAILDSNDYKDPYSKFDLLIAVDANALLSTSYGNAFVELSHFRKQNSDWIIGGFGYDLKNEIEELTSENSNKIQFPDLFFFAPKHLLILKGDELEIKSPYEEEIINEIFNIHIEPFSKQEEIKISTSFNKKSYLETVKAIQEEIERGNIYETNFCVEFYSEGKTISPISIYEKLNQTSPTPFSSYIKWNNLYVLCASPERFIAKRDDKLISQPIKGTAKRGKTQEEDELLKKELAKNPKEQQENVMIVDLVRNDLTKSAKESTVKVDELFGIYSFEQVHQMISTISCTIKEGLSEEDIIKNTFPMGSMTGAPKVKAMELMEHYEKSKRGIYSGALGYFSPENDFDFNVVIRSILYNDDNKYLSFHAGSAITYYADPEKEYEECLLKISAMLSSLNGKLI
jgi:para-aminobenzoate synthetase component 1